MKCTHLIPIAPKDNQWKILIVKNFKYIVTFLNTGQFRLWLIYFVSLEALNFK